MADTTDMPSDEAREFARKHFDGDIDAAVLLDEFAAPYKVELKLTEDENTALTSQVAALREVVGGLIALIQETANHDHQASDWGVFVRDARTALADTQATAARVIREAEARGMEMAAEWHREQARQLEILLDAKFRNAQSTAYTEHVGSAHILREAAARHRAEDGDQ